MYKSKYESCNKYLWLILWCFAQEGNYRPSNFPRWSLFELPTYFTESPSKHSILLPSFQLCQGDCLPRTELCLWQGSLVGSWKRCLHTCLYVPFPFSCSVKYNTYVQCLQHALFILKGKRMINIFTSLTLRTPVHISSFSSLSSLRMATLRL